MFLGLIVSGAGVFFEYKVGMCIVFFPVNEVRVEAVRSSAAHFVIMSPFRGLSIHVLRVLIDRPTGHGFLWGAGSCLGLNIHMSPIIPY